MHILSKARQRYITDGIPDNLRISNIGNTDSLTSDGNSHRIEGTTSDHGKNHIRTGLSLHLGGTPGRCFSIDRYSVDGYNHISGDHARLYCRRTRIRLDNQHSAVGTLLDKRTDASVGTRRHYFKIFSLFFRNVCSIGIERLEHRFDTDGYDFTIIYGINISFGKLFQYRILNLHILS